MPCSLVGVIPGTLPVLGTVVRICPSVAALRDGRPGSASPPKLLWCLCSRENGLTLPNVSNLSLPDGTPALLSFPAKSSLLPSSARSSQKLTLPLGLTPLCPPTASLPRIPGKGSRERDSALVVCCFGPALSLRELFFNRAPADLWSVEKIAVWSKSETAGLLLSPPVGAGAPKGTGSTTLLVGVNTEGGSSEVDFIPSPAAGAGLNLAASIKARRLFLLGLEIVAGCEGEEAREEERAAILI